jgi:predicted amidohydrolase
VTYPGRSLVVDPKGEIIADAGPDEGVLSVDLQPATVDAWRAEFPALRDARF